MDDVERKMYNLITARRVRARLANRAANQGNKKESIRNQRIVGQIDDSITSFERSYPGLRRSTIEKYLST